MAGIERWRLLLAAEKGLEDRGGHRSEPLADEAVQEKVDSGVQQRQHVGHISHQVEQSGGARLGWLRGVQMIQDHDGPWCPQHGKHRGDDQQDCSGFPGGITAETKAATSAAELPNDHCIKREED